MMTQKPDWNWGVLSGVMVFTNIYLLVAKWGGLSILQPGQWTVWHMLNHSIAFYGKVIDQKGEAVQDAQVTLTLINNFSGNKKYLRVTDSKGCFKLDNVRGMQMGGEVSKAAFDPYLDPEFKQASHHATLLGIS